MFTSIKQFEDETSFVKTQVVKDCKESNIRRVCFLGAVLHSVYVSLMCRLKWFNKCRPVLQYTGVFDNLKLLYKKEFGVKAGKKQ